MAFDFDFIVVGSGFGGSVSALRLVEKGYSVCVIEQGKRFTATDFPKTNWDVRRYLWAPLLKCFGIQRLSFFSNILVLSGTGVGGGSLVYANTLLQPSDEFFNAPAWRGLADWKGELLPHYATARRMLGVTTNPKLTFVDEVLRECAEEMGRGGTFKPSEVAVFFGEPGKKVKDPYFGGEGPDRTGCTFCGGCMVGCRHGAKNTLDRNYLFFAEKRGARVLPETRVTDLRPIDGGYELDVERSTAWFAKDRRKLRARRVVLSAGVLGTLRLLLGCKHVSKTLSNLSPRLGEQIRTNSEALIGVTEPGAGGKGRDYSEGIAISSIFHPDEHTHVEPVRYSQGSSFMKLLAVPMVDGGGGVPRWIRLIGVLLSHPLKLMRLALGRAWAERTVIFLVMQTLDTQMRFALGRGFLTGFKKGLVTRPASGAGLTVPSYIAVGHRVARAFAKKVGGIPQSAVNEVLLGIPTTAHILGGCGIGASPETGVLDANQQVYGYPGLYVCDGSAIPANLGVNPSLTITAMTERAMSKISTKVT